MRIILFIHIFIIVSCSSPFRTGHLPEGSKNYSYVDESGNFDYRRDFKKDKQLLISRLQLIEKSDGKPKMIEKSLMVSRLGSIKNKKNRLLTVRPEAAEYLVWIEGKRYSNRMQLDSKKRSMNVRFDGLDIRGQNEESIIFPKSRYFCFWGQLPECLFYNHLLQNAYSNQIDKISFYIIWESYPFNSDLYTGLEKGLFTQASLKFEGELDNLLRFSVDFMGQSIFYHFDRSFHFVKAAWISQGVTIAPPGQAIVEDE